MLIAVISDTHDRLPPGLPALLGRADEIWHLGDVCDPGILFALAQSGKPLHVVRGNCDESFHKWPLTLRREIHGVRCQLVHDPLDFARAPRDSCDIILHGHWHIIRDETLDGIRWLSPGSVSFPRGGTPPCFGWLSFARGKPAHWRIERLAEPR